MYYRRNFAIFMFVICEIFKNQTIFVIKPEKSIFIKVYRKKEVKLYSKPHLNIAMMILQGTRKQTKHKHVTS